MTTQPLTTYRIRYRRPNSDGAHGYEGPEFDVREITVTTCGRHDGTLEDLLYPMTTGKDIAPPASVCDVCVHEGSLLTVLIERALGV
jgi:hypothetical protein